MKPLAALIVGLAAVCGAVLIGQQVRDTAGTPSGPPPAGTGAIAGIVTTAGASPAPIRRAIVVLNGANASVDRSVVTDDLGRFAFDRLPPGSYTITASKPAYISTAYGARRPGGTGTPVSLSNGQALRNLAIPLARGGVVSGVIRDSDGRPSAGVRISVFRADQPQVRTGGPMASDQIVTDDRGEYRAFGLASGEYVVAGVGSAPGGGDVAVRRAEEVDALLKDLEQRSAIARNGSTAPPASPTPPLHGEAQRTFNLAPTYYPGTPNPADAARVPVTAGSERSGVDFTVAPVPAVTIEGLVTGFTPDENVALMISNGTEGTFGVSSASPRLVVRPGDDGGRGRFVYTNVTPGRYTISARSVPGQTGADAPSGVGQIPPGTDVLWAIAEVTVNGFDVNGVSLALQPGVTFAGRAVFDGAAAGRPKDLTTVRVRLDPILTGPQAGSMSVNGTGIGMPQRSTYSSLDADGTFAVRGLLPGRYRLATTVPEWRLASAAVGGRDVLDAPLEVAPGVSVSDAVLTFTDWHSELGGTLQNPAGIPAPEYTVVVFPADRALWSSARRVQSTRPATDGRFSFRDLPAGTYLIAALTDVEPGEWTTAAFLETLMPAAVPVALADGETKRQDLRVARMTQGF